MVKGQRQMSQKSNNF